MHRIYMYIYTHIHTRIRQWYSTNTYVVHLPSRPCGCRKGVHMYVFNIYTDMYVCVHIIHTYICISFPAYMHVYLNVYVYTLYICIYIYIHACIHVYTHTYIHTYIYRGFSAMCVMENLRIHTYIHTYIHRGFSAMCGTQIEFAGACLPTGYVMIYACVYLHKLHMHSCIHACMHTYIHTCTYRGFSAM